MARSTMETQMLTLPAFEQASKTVTEVTQETKLVYSPYFSKRNRS